MSRKKGDSFSEVVVGIFMLSVLSLLVYFTIVISGVDIIRGKEKTTIYVAFSDVGGLKEHDNVMYRGTKVGVIEDVEITPSNLVVEVEIDRSVVLRESCRIAVCNLSMLGGNYLLLEEGEGKVLPLDSTRFQGERPTDWMRDVSNIAKDISDFTSGREFKSMTTNLEVAICRIRQISDRLERGEGLLGSMLASNDTVYADLKRTMSNVSEISARIVRGEGTVGALLSTNDTVYADLKRTMSSAAEIAERLERGEGVVGSLLSKDDPLVGEVRSAVAAFRKACDGFDTAETVNSANRLLASLNEVAEKVNNGVGTLGRLVNDSELYDELNGLSKDLRQVLDNFRDTTPITTFTSLVTGGL